MTAGFIPYAAPRVADPEQAGRAFLERIGVFLPATRHVREIAPVDAHRLLRAAGAAVALGLWLPTLAE